MTDWSKTRKHKSDTNLFYNGDWKVSINDIDTLTQWLQINIPFPVNVSRNEKYRTNPDRNPIRISPKNGFNLEQFIPLIKESFGNYSDVINNGDNSFTFIVDKVCLINNYDTVRKEILNKMIREANSGYSYNFDSYEELMDFRSIVFNQGHDFPEDKLYPLTRNPRYMVNRFILGFWVAKEEFDEWLNDLRKAYKILIDLAV